ncbi:MAG: hypothetical protein LC777_12850 [Actinobacteria bacterium]|nr:hypothetical protein [Actinomycetota bacterium]
MYGRTRKEHIYMTCHYARTYGKVAAEQIEGHGQRLYVREDNRLPLVERSSIPYTPAEPPMIPASAGLRALAEAVVRCF